MVEVELNSVVCRWVIHRLVLVKSYKCRFGNFQTKLNVVVQLVLSFHWFGLDDYNLIISDGTA